ncbi:hypothetical protein AXF42_Ash016013 [Apostasia shenzhenica]|uniref:Uncharacterized protein n=1 Tax=Apostasia shenzhenica TaxID=1088818 RepID=A0A2I0AWM6_9ASPA|nr:hypothetical protein AXF42_Ash016013 [Apostasia shenzhenica]
MENFIVERAWAGVALGWVTSWEVLKHAIFLKPKRDNTSAMRSQDVTIWYQSQPPAVRCDSRTNQAEAGGPVTPVVEEGGE